VSARCPSGASDWVWQKYHPKKGAQRNFSNLVGHGDNLTLPQVNPLLSRDS
jgi:hypothetical protein